MVTIEQKLSMFNKLLKRSMDDNFAAEIEFLRKDYSKKLQQSKSDADKEAKNIEENAYKRAEKEKAKILNQSAIAQRTEYMSAKEELFSAMLENLKSRIGEFIRSKEYKDYLISLAKQLSDSEKPSEHISILMTAADIKQYGEDVKLALTDLFKGAPNIKAANAHMIGGLILMNSESDIRIDLSIKTLLEEGKPAMMQILFQELSPVQNEEQQVK